MTKTDGFTAFVWQNDPVDIRGCKNSPLDYFSDIHLFLGGNALFKLVGCNTIHVIKDMNL